MKTAPPTAADKEASHLRFAAKMYYGGSPIMSDADFDSRRRAFIAANPGHPYCAEVGSPPESSKKVQHATTMGSLDNAFSPEEIRAWVERVTKLCETRGREAPKTVVISDKLDGLSVQLSYRAGRLKVAATRGDGREGEDVTSNVVRSGVPQELDEAIDVDVRGEMVILKEDFRAHFTDCENERNAAAGTVRRQDGARAEHLTFIAFDANPVGDSAEWNANETRVNAWLVAQGFRAVGIESVPFDAQKIAEAWAARLLKKDNLPYLADGCVIKINGRLTATALGWTGGCPRGAIAGKWRGTQVGETDVIGIRLSVGHTGAITGVAQVRGVTIGGVCVQNVSLMNWDEVERLSVKHALGVGSKVKIERCGDVIPRVLEVITGSAKPFGRPESCPACNAETFKDGPRQVCGNPECPAQTFRTVLRWVKGRTIMFLGEETLDRLMAVGGPVSSAADLYDLTPENLGGGAMASKILAELEKSRDCTPAQVLGNIGIRGIGETEAGKACDYLRARSLADVVEAPLEAFIAAIGPARGRALYDGIRENVDTLAALNARLRVAPPTKRATVAGGGDWAGKTYCITGATELARGALQRVINGAGGTWKGSVVNGLDFLIVASVPEDRAEWSTKLKAADRKGVKVIDEPTALKMANYAGS